MSKEKNKWSQPAAPPPPLFLGEKERDLVKQFNDELIERVIGQVVAYYPIDLQHTNFHPLYNEAVVKTFLPPVRVHALVEFKGQQTKTDKYGVDKMTSITVHFHKRRLTEDQDLFVREGDFVAYGDSFYEIVSLKEQKELFGQEFGVFYFAPILFVSIFIFLFQIREKKYLLSFLTLLTYLFPIFSIIVLQNTAFSYGFRYLFVLIPLNCILYFKYIHND